MALPPGFVLDPPAQGGPIPPQGFVLDAPPVSFQNGTRPTPTPGYGSNGQPLGFQGNNWDAVARMLEPLTLHGLLSQPTRLINQVAGTRYADPNTAQGLDLSGLLTTPLQMGEQGLGLPQGALTGPTSPIAGLAQGAEQIGGQFTSPENVAQLPLFGAKAVTPVEEMAKRILMGLYGGQQAAALPGQIGQAGQVQMNPQASTAEKISAAMQPAAGAGLAMMLGQEAMAPKIAPPSGVKPQDMSPNIQHEDLAASDYQARATRPSGAMDIPILGQQAEPPPMTLDQSMAQALLDSFQRNMIVPGGKVPTKPPVEGSGGEISFRGQGVPSARQQGFPLSYDEEVASAPPEQITGPTAPFQRTSPLTPEQEQARILKANVAKGLYGPATQYTGSEEQPYAREGQYPEEGGPQGTLSNLQSQRIQAGQPSVRSNVQNNPPIQPPISRPGEGGETQEPTVASKEPTTGVGPFDIGKQLGLKVAKWPDSLPVIGGTYSFTDPKTGFTVEGFKEGVTAEEVQKRLAEKGGQGASLQTTPALMLNDGTIIQGKPGQMHYQILDAHPELSEKDVLDGGVVKNGQYLPRNAEMTAGEHTSPEDVAKVNQFTQEFNKGGDVSEQGQTAEVQQVGQEGANTQGGGKDVVAEGKQGEQVPIEKRGPQGGNVSSLGFFDPAFWGSQLGVAKNAAVDAKQLYNRMRNKLGEMSASWDMLDTDEFRKFMVGTKSPEDVRKWVEENGLRVEVRKMGRGNQTAIQKEADTFRHNWYDALPQRSQSIADSFVNNNTQLHADIAYKQLQAFARAEGLTEPKARELLTKWSELRDVRGGEQSHWQSIAPKSEQDMPGYVEIAVTKPLKDRIDERGVNVGNNKSIQFPSSHNFPPNTLCFVRGYMETLPNGKKVFHVIEVQSDWAQQLRDYKTSEDFDASRDHSLSYKKAVNKLEDPLLPHYERLALKAAIEHARSEGADAIAISDAETAMMTEGHDRGAYRNYLTNSETHEGDWILKAGDGYIHKYPSEQEALKAQQTMFKGEQTEVRRATKQDVEDVLIRPSQEQGMRLHYDRTLPKIAEELTGSKGEKVGFGEHRMALEYPNRVGHVEDAKVPRKDLIFHNEQGQPKTDVTARLYPIEKAKKDFTYAGSDRAAKGEMLPMKEGKPQIEPSGEGAGITPAAPQWMKDAVDDIRKTGRKISNALKGGQERRDIAQDRDAWQNKVTVLGQNEEKGISGQAKNLFGKDSDTALAAATVAREANDDPSKLAGFISIAQKAKNVEAEKYAQFAQKNWAKLQPIVARMKADTDYLHDELNANGILTDYREGYAKHIYDPAKLPGSVKDNFFGPSGTGRTSGSQKMRSFPTLYDAIDAGYGDAIQSWDAAKITRNTLEQGYSKLNDKYWADQLSQYKDPTTSKPVVADMQRQKNPATGKVTLVPPKGYQSWVFGNHTYAVHEGYADLLNELTATSAIAQWSPRGIPVGKALLKGTSALKHSMLVYDSYHAVRMAAKGLSLKGDASYGKGLSLLEYSDKDLATAVKNGEITQPMADYAKSNRAIGNAFINNGLNIGRVAENLWSSSESKLGMPGANKFNTFVFQKMTRGIMMESAIHEYKRLAPKGSGIDLPTVRKVAKDMNIYFGNLGRQGVFKSATFQDLARLVFLAPQWFESMAQTEARSIGQVAKGAVTGKLGSLGKGTGALLVAMLAGTQVANLVSKGQPTWNNEEGHKFDAWIPDATGKGKGFYLSPFSLPMELTHDIIRYHEAGKSPLGIMGQIIGNKLSPAMRAEETLRTQRDYKGQKLTDTEAVGAAAKNLMPLPLPAQAGLNKGQSVQRQLTAMAGMKTEPASTDRSRMARLAERFKEQKGIPPDMGDYPTSRYADLLDALKKGDAGQVREEYNTLATNDHEKAVIQQYFVQLPNHRFTGSKALEGEFVEQLAPEDKVRYEQTKADSAAIQKNFFNIVLQQAAPRGAMMQSRPVRQPRYR